MNIQDITDNIDDQIFQDDERNYNGDNADWQHCYGILLSRNEAQALVDYIEELENKIYD